MSEVSIILETESSRLKIGMLLILNFMFKKAVFCLYILSCDKEEYDTRYEII